MSGRGVVVLGMEVAGGRLGGGMVRGRPAGGDCVCLEGVKKKGKVNRVRMRREADGGAT